MPEPCRRLSFVLATALTSALPLPCASAQDHDPDDQSPAEPAATLVWADFRGPARHGVRSGVTPPLEWSAESNLRWQCALPGPGSSNPIPLGGRVYLTCYSGYGIDLDDPGAPSDLRHHVIAVDADSGELVWDRVIPSGRTEPARPMQLREHGFASPSLVSDGERLFAYFGQTGLLALDFDGEVVWQTSLGDFASKDSQEPRPEDRSDLPTLRWGAAATPLIWGDLVIVNASEESDSIRAIDRRTGELVWKVESVKLEGSAVPPVVAGDGEDEVLIICPGGETWALDPRTGALHWQVSTGTRGGLSAVPICHDGIAVTFGGGKHSHALRLAADLDDDTDRLVWKGLNTDIPSPVLHEGRIFMVQASGLGACIALDDAEVVFRGRLPGRTGGVYAAPVIAGGRLYVVSREKGVFVYSIDGEFELLAHNVIETDSSQFHGTPAFVGDRIYLRSNQVLYAIGG